MTPLPITELSPTELERYRRQMMLPGLGESGQKQLKETTALVTGVGGLGGTSHAALSLAFQANAGISIDGEVYTQTWKELAGRFDQTLFDIPGENPRLKLANFAIRPACVQLKGVVSKVKTFDGRKGRERKSTKN